MSAPEKFGAWLLDNELELTDEWYVRVFLGMDDESGTTRTTRNTKVQSYKARVQTFMRTLQTEPRKWWYHGTEFLLPVLVRWLHWDLTLVRAYENLEGLVQSTYGWENGVMRYNFFVAPDGRDLHRVWMIYYDGISGTDLAHYDVLRRLPQLVLLRNATPPSSPGEAPAIGTSLGDAKMAHDEASGDGFAAQQAVPPWDFYPGVFANNWCPWYRTLRSIRPHSSKNGRMRWHTSTCARRIQ